MQLGTFTDVPLLSKKKRLDIANCRTVGVVPAPHMLALLSDDDAAVWVERARNILALFTYLQIRPGYWSQQIPSDEAYA
jgi:hypothetical protein